MWSKGGNIRAYSSRGTQREYAGLGKPVFYETESMYAYEECDIVAIISR